MQEQRIDMDEELRGGFDVKEKLQEKLENGKLTEGDIESMVKNPYKEENFEIEKSMSGSFLVRSDSERFGERAIVYEDRNRNNCVNYIEDRQPAKEPTYYVIENLHEFVLGKNENIIWGTLEECLEKYKGYVASVELEKNAYKDKVTCTLGVTTDKNDMDLIHCINGTSYAGIGMTKNKEHNINKYILNDLGYTVEALDIKQAVLFRAGNIEYTSLSQLEGKEVFESGSKERKEQLQDMFVNGVRLPKTGYNGAPEVTQELFDQIVQKGTKDLDFKGCYFSEVTISGKFENASFENGYIFECNFENVEFLHSNFEKARISDTNLKNVAFSEVNFSNASLKGSRWEETKFQNVDFINSTWKQVSTVQDTVSFENCDFLLADMDSVNIKGSQVIGEIKNTESIYVTMGGATKAEVKRHEQSIMETLNANNDRNRVKKVFSRMRLKS